MIRVFRAVVLTGIAACFVLPQFVQAQTPAPAQDRRLKLFLDCFRCDFDFIRTEIPWVDYMRDRQDADLHVLVTQQGTGGGGQQYVLNFIGLGAFQSHVDTLRYTSSPDDTEDIRRRGLARVLALGLVRYVADTPLAARVRVVLDEPAAGRATAPVTAAEDPWDYWVFNIRAGGEYQAETRESEKGSNVEVEVNRTTETWKFNFGLEGSYNERDIEIDSVTTIVSIRKSFQSSLLLVRSVGQHVAFGLEGEFESSTFGNVEAALNIGPAVEFSLFPYTESTRRALTALYSAGVRSARYREITVFDETEEVRPAHALWVVYSARQPWGSASANANFSQYLHDTSKNSVSVGGNINVRLFRGFSFDVRANYSKVNDQLSIPREDATTEEILLRLKQLRTDFRYSMDVGLNYRFGSSFNNVVNPRFRRGFGRFGGGGGGG